MKRSIPKKMLKHSRGLRNNATDAEWLLWSRLRSGRLCGFKFRRQHVIGAFIVDFYCHEAKLAIELDGGGHAEPLQGDYDEERTLEMESQGLKVLRFWNNDVMSNMEGVLETILAALTPALSRREREKDKPHLPPRESR